MGAPLKNKPPPAMARWNAVFFVSIALIAFLVYLNATGGDFVFDDAEVIVKGELIKSFGNLPKLVSTDYFDVSSELSYRPVVTFSYLVDRSLWGLNPLGYRLTNIVLHALNGVFLYFLLCRTIGLSWAAAAGAALFVVHPALAEAVNVPSYREDLLVFFFAAASLLLYFRMRESAPRSRYRGLLYSGHLTSFALALFSKEMAATLPALLILLDRAVADRSVGGCRSRFSPRYAGHFAVLGFYFAVRFLLLKNPGEAFFSGAGATLSQRALTAAGATAHYLRLLFFPMNLNAFYDYFPASTQFVPTAAAGVAAVFFLLWSAFVCWRTRRFFAVAAWWFLIALGPVYNFVPLNIPIAERYLYLPAAAFSMFFGAFMLRLEAGTERKSGGGKLRLTAFACWAVVLLSFSALTMSRNAVWKSDFALWTDTAGKSPRSAVARNNLGNAYYARAEMDKAIAEYKSSLAADKRRLWVLYNLGSAYLAVGRERLAITQYEAALELDPGFILALVNLSNLLSRSGELDAALRYGLRALAIAPSAAKVHFNLSDIYSKKGLSDKAEASFRAYLYLNRFGKDAQAKAADRYRD